MNVEDAYALVIGVSAYQHVRPLPAVQDAQDVAAVLSDPELCGYPAANVRVLLEEAATRAAILDALDELVTRARPSSTVFVYFSGHGGTASHGGAETCYLMPVDARWSDPAALEATAVAGAELSQRLRDLAANRVTVVLDCCRAAGLAEAKDIEIELPLGDLTRGALSPLANGRGRAVLAASRADGRAFVKPGQRNGVFTHHLLDGLRGGAARAGGVIRICDLFQYVQEHVTAEQPGQRPVFKAELEENYAIARTRAPTPMTVSPPPDEFAYDVFLSYARRDPMIRAWVERVLVPFLEGCGIKICLEDPGAGGVRPAPHEIESAVAISRYTLAVVTPSYLEDQSGDFPAVLAQHMMLETDAPRLMPVLLRPCRFELDPRMTGLLDLTRGDDAIAGLLRLALALRERPHPRLDS